MVETSGLRHSGENIVKYISTVINGLAVYIYISIKMYCCICKWYDFKSLKKLYFLMDIKKTYIFKMFNMSE